MKTSQPRHTTCPGSLPVERTAAKALFTLLLAATLPLLCSGCLVIPLTGLMDQTGYSEQVIEKGDGLFAGNLAVIELSGVDPYPNGGPPDPKLMAGAGDPNMSDKDRYNYTVHWMYRGTSKLVHWAAQMCRIRMYQN